MSFLKKLFAQKDESGPPTSYREFWDWFIKNEKAFYKVIKERGNIDSLLFQPLSTQLAAICSGCNYQAGMAGDSTAEIVFTPDGIVKNFVFVEELVDAAPKIDGWLFTKLKPALAGISIKMDGYEFNADTLAFYANVDEAAPDNIAITVVHNLYNEQNKGIITQGTYIFIDNYIGELNSIETIDNIIVAGPQTGQELIPLSKLNEYLVWRQNEFIEKYDSERYDASSDLHSVMEGMMDNGDGLVAIVNTQLLNWERKASHPWIMKVKVGYDGISNGGMPDKHTVGMMNIIEGELNEQLKDVNGYLAIGRQTGDNTREIYFACKDFRLPSKVADALSRKYADRLEISYDLYKDKYWQSFDCFQRPVD